MTVPSTIADIYTVAGSNPPGGGENPSEGDNHIRAGYSFIAQLRDILNGTSTTTATVKSLIVSLNAAVSGNLSVAGTMTAGATSLSSLAVTGNETVGGTLGVTGASTVAALTASGVVTIPALHATSNLVAGGVVNKSDTYTPAASNLNNLDSATPGVAQYIRFGNCVLVSGAITLDPTTASISTSVNLSFPIASNIGATTQGGGYAMRASGANLPASMQVVAATDNVLLTFVNDTGTASATWTYLYMYQVI